MAKQAYEYYKVHPWKIEEVGFNSERNRVSESIFSLANEYMGIRGFIEEGVSCDSLIGSYFNGIYENSLKENETHYKGIVKRTHFMVNSVNWLYTRIYIDGKLLDINKLPLNNFTRSLCFKTGVLTRKFTITHQQKTIEFTFKRFLSMRPFNYAYQQISIKASDDVEIKILMGLDYSILHFGKDNFWEIEKYELQDYLACAIGKTLTTNQKVFSGYIISANINLVKAPFKDDKLIGHELKFTASKDKLITINKNIANVVDKFDTFSTTSLWNKGYNLLQDILSFDEALNNNTFYWQRVWDEYDIEIIGDEKNQQGIRFCLFQLQQTYNGVDASNNIGAKGLTGEAYSGHAFWDTETYCLPFFIFNNKEAARNLLLYRYNTLDMARKRALELDCKGACFPIATLNGYEACDLWQHASLQLQPSTAVSYGIWHYVKNTLDKEFLYHYGLEMLLEISRFLLSRGDWNSDRTKFGFYGVMGPDEFQMMVNHNAYTNYMAKRTFAYTIEVYQELKKVNQKLLDKITEKINFSEKELTLFIEAKDAMYIPYDPNTLLFEQHEGYFDLPHIDIDKIPIEEFPLYSHWSYDRIYRNDMIKQPDVLMFMFLYNQSFTKEQKFANYEFYEPRCIHESSLSPSIHSVFAAELDKIDEAVDFFSFATRMDIDDYNRNTNEGLHMTSIAASWINIVYGFGGFRSDGEDLILNPIIPPMWEQFSFKFKYLDNLIKVIVNKKHVVINCIGSGVDLVIYGKKYQIKGEELVIPVRNG